LTLLLCAPSASALGRLQSYVERGGADVLVNLSGSRIDAQRSCPGASVLVRKTGTITNAVIYSNSTLTLKSNPFTADLLGSFDFYTNESSVDIQFTGCGSTWTRYFNVTSGGGSTGGAIACANAAADQTAIAAAIAAVPVAGGSVEIGSGRCAITANLAFPANTTLKIDQGAEFYIDPAVTVTISGPFDAGRYGVFTLVDSSTSVVSLGGLTPHVYPEWFGTGASAMQAAINATYTLHQPVVLGAAKYSIGTTTANITSSYTRIISEFAQERDGYASSPVTNTWGTIEYTGTGTAIKVGKSFGVTGDRIQGFQLDHVRIICTNLNASALDLWTAVNFELRSVSVHNVNVAAPAGSGNFGIRVRGYINSVIDSTEVNGFFEGIALESFAGAGGDLPSGTVATTITFIGANLIGYCNTGIRVTGAFFEIGDHVEFNGISSRCLRLDASIGHVSHAWFENVGTAKCLSLTNSSRLHVTNSTLNNHSTAQYMVEMPVGSGASFLWLNDCTFIHAHATPRLIDQTNFSTSSRVLISNPHIHLSPNFKISTTTYPSSLTHGERVIVTSMREQIVGYHITLLPANATTALFDVHFAESVGVNFSSVSRAGHVVGLRLLFSTSPAATPYNYAVKKNGATIFSESGSGAVVLTRWAEYYAFTFAAGDLLSIEVTTPVGFTPCEVYAELITAQGYDGIQ
jgi:hypothetical protein